MKLVLISFFLILTALAFSQQVDTTKTRRDSVPYFASFTTRFNIANATKDGFYINGYVVNINYEYGKKLNGKIIKVSGKVTIVRGVKNSPHTNEERQGRQNDTQHILNPKIEVISF